MDLFLVAKHEIKIGSAKFTVHNYKNYIIIIINIYKYNKEMLFSLGKAVVSYVVS